MCQLCQAFGQDLHKVYSHRDVPTVDSSYAAITDPAALIGLAQQATTKSVSPGDSIPTGQSPLTDTVPGSTATSFTHSNATYVRGFINTAGDQDWYAVNLIAGQTYTFAMNGFGKGAIADTFLSLRNSSGTQIASDDDSGPLAASKLTFTAASTGTYYISAGGWAGADPAGSVTGQYVLTMNDGTMPFFPVVPVNDIADYLTNTYWEVNGSRAHQWGATSITFNCQGLEPERAALARLAFQTWDDLCGLTFSETFGAAQITLDDNASGAFANSSFNGSGVISSATINVAKNWFGGDDAVDSYTFQTFIHEIGHTLGLGHGGPYNGSATYGVDNSYANDSWQLSIMSYMDQSDYGSASDRFVMTPQMADIMAVQSLYGSAATRSGDTVYGFNGTAGALFDFSTYATAPALTIYDSDGIDSLDCSGYSSSQTIDLTPGGFCNIGGYVGNIGIFTTTTIERAIGGSGGDTITGNSAANWLRGRGGNDTISGGGGTDSAIFSGSRSAYALTDLGGGSVQVAGPDGTDTLSSIELLVFDDQTVTWPPAPSNLAPNITSDGGGETATLVRSENGTTVTTVSATDPDAGTTLSYFIFGGADQARFQINSATGALSFITAPNFDAPWDSDQNNSYTVEVRVSDNGSPNLSDTQTITVNITDIPGANLVGDEGDNTLIGTPENDALHGLGGNDNLSGDADNDLLDGGPGSDFMSGGTGDDQFFVDNLSDVANEATGQGNDRVWTSVSYALTAGSEIETLTTTNHTGVAPINLTGNSFAQLIVGNDGNNIIDGGGGADTMMGRAGDDQFFVSHPGAAAVIESVGQGIDRVWTTVSHALTPSSEIEIFTTTNHTGTAGINLTGNSFAQLIVGNDGNNLITGGGGADTLIGREGDDQYFVSSPGAAVIESTGQGIDGVWTATSYALTLGSEIEFFTTTNLSGTIAINLTGNDIGQFIEGNHGNNLIDGGGGADRMVGHAGDDQFFIDSLFDVVNESTGQGIDRVWITTSYALTSGAEIETFTTTNHGGTAAIDLTGNELAQLIVGNDGNNVINGGAGSDTLLGRAGSDVYLFNTALGPSNIDDLTDFSGANDIFNLDDAVFSGLPTGMLSANAFFKGEAAHDADDRIIYNSSTGALFFDADGTGGIAAQQFANIAPGIGIDNSYFIVV